MEKDIVKIQKNQDTDIVVRIDDFGGKIGLTIREFVKSERYTGFTKAGTRIPLDQIGKFKEAINSIDESDLQAVAAQAAQSASSGENLGEKEGDKPKKAFEKKQANIESDFEEQAM